VIAQIVQPFDPRHLAIIACQRRLPKQHSHLRRVVGVRWASRPDFGFPTSGYIVRRRGEGAGESLGVFWLPSTKSWDAFRDDALARRPLAGPYFPSIDHEQLGHLLPIVRLADPRTSEVEHEALTQVAAAFFGDIHAGDAALAWNLWPFRSTPPPLADLLGEPLARAAIIQYYRRRASDYLLALALRFEYAVLFGLATDDAPPARATVAYVVGAAWKHGRAVARTDWKTPNHVCVVPAPGWAAADRAPGSVAHPAFAIWPGWQPPADFAPTDGDGTPLPATSLVPRAPAAFSALTWAEAAPEPALIGHGPVLYRLRRFAHGRHTAKQTTPPLVPPGAVFEPVVDGEDILRSSEEPSFLDLPGMAWPPLEGHYDYSVRGVNLLGIVSDDDARANIRHHDDLRPMAPRARSLSEPTVALGVDGAVITRLRIDWDAREDFSSPDVVSFRVAASWTATVTTTLHVLSVVDAGPLHVDLSIENLPAAPDALAGARLCTAGGDFPIVSHGTGAPSTMRVRRIAGRIPVAGEHGTVFSAAPPTARTRIAELRRRTLVAATVEDVASTAPLELRLTAATDEALPIGEPVRLYLHLFRTTFDALPIEGGWRIDEPGPDDPARAMWERWLALGDPRAALRDSPALLFPRHELEVRVVAPPGFDAGLLELSISSADGTEYVASPAMPAVTPALMGLRGNESAATPVAVSVRSKRSLPAVVVIGTEPGTRLWASSAAVYEEGAEFTVRWNAIAGAVRYEIWRALGTDDAGAFAFRGNSFGTSFADRLPGRAPTTAYYRVRAVGANGVAGAMSDAIGPVFVPDVRPPPRPNLLRATAQRPEIMARSIAVEWTQSGDTAGVRFEVERQDRDLFSVVGTIAAGTAPSDAGVYRFVDTDRTPGRLHQYRVVAYREVADPVDPSGVTIRSIASPRSETRAASAVGTASLAPPNAVSATVDAPTRQVNLTWTNEEPYESIAIRRRAADAYVYELVATVAGDATAYVHESVAPGAWKYQIRVRGIQREGRSDDLLVEVP
jgi:hypothetical protein